MDSTPAQPTDVTDVVVTSMRGASGDKMNIKEALHVCLNMYYGDTSDISLSPNWSALGVKNMDWPRKKEAVRAILQYLQNSSEVSGRKFIVATHPYKLGTKRTTRLPTSVRQAQEGAFKSIPWKKKYFRCELNSSVYVHTHNDSIAGTKTGSWSANKKLQIHTIPAGILNVYHVTLNVGPNADHRCVLTVYAFENEGQKNYEICCFDPNGHAKNKSQHEISAEKAQKTLAKILQILVRRNNKTLGIRAVSSEDNSGVEQNTATHAMTIFNSQWEDTLPWPFEGSLAVDKEGVNVNKFSLFEIKTTSTICKFYVNRNNFTKVSASDEGGNCLWASTWLTAAFKCQKPTDRANEVEGTALPTNDLLYMNKSNAYKANPQTRLRTIGLVTNLGQLSVIPPFFMYYSLGLMLLKDSVRQHAKNKLKEALAANKIHPKFQGDVNRLMQIPGSDADGFVEWYWTITTHG